MSGAPIVGLVPARGGSVGIPRKNLIDVGGEPLLAHTARAALAATTLTRVMLSTDDEEIADVGERLGLDVPFRRPAHLGGSRTPMVDVIAHAFDWLARDGIAAGGIALLQPTSPLRSSADIDGAVSAFLRTGAPSVVSVVEIPHNYAPPSAVRLDPDSRVHPATDRPGPLRRQDKEVFYARNGPAVLVTSPGVAASGDLYPDGVVGYVMPRSRSWDVDDPEDLALIRALLRDRSDRRRDHHR